MAQVFRPRANALLRLIVIGLVVVIALVGTALWRYSWSNWVTEQEWASVQPVPFSHEHHVSGLGIDCRYCHTSVQISSSAGMPSTHTCMSCHSQVWTEAPVLEPVRESYRTGQPIQWRRIYDLPDFAYFNHSAHVNKGVGCETCHGRVDQMPFIQKAVSLHMSWCLNCHRSPEQYLRPLDYIYAFGYDLPQEQQLRVGHALLDKFDIQPAQLDNCSTCHR